MKATTAPPKAGAAVAASCESATRSPALCSQAAVVSRSNVVVITDDVQTIELLAYMGGRWPPQWLLRSVGNESELRVSFPPSFVLAGSSKAELVRTDCRRVFEFGTNGYQCEWEMLHDAVTRDAVPFVSLDDVVNDIVYALDIADQVDRWLEMP